MTNNQKLVALGVLLYLLWKGTGSTTWGAPVTGEMYGPPVPQTTGGFKITITNPATGATIQPTDGAISTDANGNCYKFDAANNSWYPC